MADIVTFGEAMIRLAAPSFRRLEQTTTLDLTVGGAELNVACGVARLGLSARWVSALPDNTLGWIVRNRAREMNVDVSCVQWDAATRMGLYFVEYGASPRASSVLYDRKGSAIAEMQGISFDWPTILTGARLFHTTGITTALSDRTAEEVGSGLATARAAGVLTSYDLNFRGKLWTAAQARVIQEPLMDLVDVLITTEEDASVVFGVEGSDYRDVARKLADKFGFKVVTITLRGDHSVLRNSWTAIAYADGAWVDDKVYDIEVVDRVGGGDAYASGFLFGYLTGDLHKAVKYGNAFSALKQSSFGDLNWATLAETEAQVRGASTRIVR
jgi:2-dehydro-3-deoxygluconokinase